MIRPAWIATTAALLVAAGTFAVTTSAQATAGFPLAAPVVTATIATAAPATPVPIRTDVRCGDPSSNHLGFTPPLTLVNQPTTVQRSTGYRNCTSLVANGITSGWEAQTFYFGDDCTMVLLPGMATFAVTWNTTQTTTFTASRSVTLSGNTLTVSFSGTVTAGLFTGSTVRQVFTATTPELVACLAGTAKLPFILSDVSLHIYH